jgi:hypothetical protein
LGFSRALSRKKSAGLSSVRRFCAEAPAFLNIGGFYANIFLYGRYTRFLVLLGIYASDGRARYFFVVPRNGRSV